MVDQRPNQATPPPANTSMGQPADISGALEILKILGYLNPMTTGLTAGIDTLSGGDPMGSLARGLGIGGTPGSRTQYGGGLGGSPMAPATRAEADIGAMRAGMPDGSITPPPQPGAPIPDVGPHPNPTGTGSPGGSGLDAGALIPDASAVADSQYGVGGWDRSTPTPDQTGGLDPTGALNMPPGPPNLGPSLDQISGGESSPMPPNTDKVGDATIYTVQPGDSLSLIGAMFGITYDELIAGNEGILGEKGKASVIHPGQKILITPPPGTAARGSKEREKVADKGLDVAGATAYSKARRKG